MKQKKGDLKVGVRKQRQGKLLLMLSEYLTYSQISKQLKIGKSSVSMAFKRFKEYGLINSDRSLTSKGLQTVNLTHSYIKTVNSIKNSEIRGHNFVFVLKKPPGIKNWCRFKEYFNLKNISFSKISNTIEGERIIINNRKIWRTNKGFVFYMGKNQDYLGKTAYDCYYNVTLDLMELIHKLEKMLNVSLRGSNGYEIKPSRSHYAIMKNALAEQYNDQEKKLLVRDEKGAWLIIDDSFNLDELETIRPGTAREENVIVQDFFNSVKKHDITMDDVLKMNHDLQTQLSNSIGMQDVYNQNIKKHLKVLGDMSKALGAIEKNLKKS